MTGSDEDLVDHSFVRQRLWQSLDQSHRRWRAAGWTLLVVTVYSTDRMFDAGLGEGKGWAILGLVSMVAAFVAGAAAKYYSERAESVRIRDGLFILEACHSSNVMKGCRPLLELIGHTLKQGLPVQAEVRSEAIRRAELLLARSADVEYLNTK